MLKLFTQKFHYKQKGFTLIELLIVVAILGVLAAVAIPNVAKFIGYGRSGMADTELHETQGCVVALMADKPVSGTINPTDFGNEDQLTTSMNRKDLTIDGKNLSTYIVGGIIKCLGHYSVDANGTVTQIWYPE